MTDPVATTSTHSRLFNILIGLAALAVLLQGVWAGLFIREGKDNNNTWVTVHARGADVAIVLAILAAIVAVARLRTRRDLVGGSILFAVLLIVEAYIGGLVSNHNALEVIHFPLAMALVGLSVWLPLRVRAARPGERTVAAPPFAETQSQT